MGLIKIAVVVVFLAVGYHWLMNYITPRPPVEVHGSCQPRFAAVKDVFRNNLETGLEMGGAFAVYHEGKLVCDLWGGWADDELQYPWQRETITMMYSATKGLSALCVLLLYDRGLLDYSQPVARYWPEFAQNGKENITVATLVSHQAGLSAVFDDDFALKLLLNDPDKMSRILAAQKPNWPPGSQSGYHALTFGLYLNELVKRVDPQHRTLQKFFSQEIAEPLELDIHFGLPRAEKYRVARETAPSLWQTIYAFVSISEMRHFIMMSKEKDPLLYRSMIPTSEWHEDGERLLQWMEYQEIPEGSVNGFSSARALAKLYGVLSNGGNYKDKQFLSQKALNKWKETLFKGTDLIIRENASWGYGIPIIPFPFGDERVMMFGAPGYGGQLGIGCFEKKLGWAYLTNHMALTLFGAPQYYPLQDAMLNAAKA